MKHKGKYKKHIKVDFNWDYSRPHDSKVKSNFKFVELDTNSSLACHMLNSDQIMSDV